MKQYTTPEQTTKLIELGFKPESIEFASDCEVVNEYGIEIIECINPQFSIGELIEILPKTIEEKIWWGDEKGKIGVWGLVINTLGVEYLWEVSYEREYSCAIYSDANTELIDALFAVVVKLKEEGVI